MPPRASTNLVKPTRAGARAAAGELDSRMYELDMNLAALAKASGVSTGIIRKLLVAQFANSYRPDKLRALSVAVRWQPDRLANLLTKATEKPGLASECCVVISSEPPSLDKCRPNAPGRRDPERAQLRGPERDAEVSAMRASSSASLWASTGRSAAADPLGTRVPGWGDGTDGIGWMSRTRSLRSKNSVQVFADRLPRTAMGVRLQDQKRRLVKKL